MLKAKNEINRFEFMKAVERLRRNEGAQRWRRRLRNVKFHLRDRKTGSESAQRRTSENELEKMRSEMLAKRTKGGEGEPKNFFITLIVLRNYFVQTNTQSVSNRSNVRSSRSKSGGGEKSNDERNKRITFLFLPTASPFVRSACFGEFRPSLCSISLSLRAR